MGERFNPFGRESKEKSPEFLHPFKTVQLLGPREAQQDYFAAKAFEKNGNRFQVNIVADGHGKGGEFYAERATQSIVDQIGKHEGVIGEDEFVNFFNGADIDTSEIIEPGGTTMSVVLLEKNHLKGAYVGDSDIKLIGKDGLITGLTKQDRLSNKEEMDRVVKTGAMVVRNRVYAAGSGINITRTIGDHDFKPALIPTPHTFEIEIHPADKYLLVASDGFWDAGEGIEKEGKVLSDLLARAKSLSGAENLVKAYLATRRQVDNITIQIIELNGN
jgi:serine/threonine protein phosphatase PrpC